jgi:tetratricopeptide (TPR) repeat protein
MNNNFERAAVDWTEVIRLDRTNAAAFFYRGDCYNRISKIDLGIRDLSESLRLNPANADAYLVRGEAYLQKSDATNGIKDLTQAIRLNSKLEPAYQYRGYLYATQCRFVEAAQDYSKALILDPTNDWTYNALARLKATCPDDSVRNGHEAVTAAKKACELTRWKERGSIQTLAAACAETGDFKRAIEYENQALRTGNPTEADVHLAEERISFYKQSKPIRDKPSN